VQIRRATEKSGVVTSAAPERVVALGAAGFASLFKGDAHARERIRSYRLRASVQRARRNMCKCGCLWCASAFVHYVRLDDGNKARRFDRTITFESYARETVNAQDVGRAPEPQGVRRGCTTTRSIKQQLLYPPHGERPQDEETRISDAVTRGCFDGTFRKHHGRTTG